jgi:hypothetical protein
VAKQLELLDLLHLRAEHRRGRPRRITPTERTLVVAVAGARPDTQGMPLTRWSLDRLSAHLASDDLRISPIHLWRLPAHAGLSFQRTCSWKASPDPEYETRAACVLELYAACPFNGRMISFDQMGPISLELIQGAGWARRKRPGRLRATYNRKHGIRYIFGALDVHRDRLRARMRPRRAGSDVLGGSIAPSARSRSSSSTTPIVPTGTPPSAASRTTSPTATDATRTAGSPHWNASTESPHEQVISGQTFWVGPTRSELSAALGG